MELPVYKIIINELDETGCTTISLVDSPAVELPFLCFDKQEQLKLSVNEDKRIISGIAMLADTPIYRRSASRGEYYIIFDKETIRKMVEKYAKNGYYNLINLQHDQEQYINSVHMCESLIIDKERGLCPIEFADVPDGSWYVSYHVEDEQLWNEIKNSNHLNGFSIEVLSDLELIETKLTTNNTMNKFFKLAKMILKLAEIKTDKETLIVEGEIEVGKPVLVETEEGPVEAADGEYTLEDGTVIVIEAGVITEIRPLEKPEEAEPEENIETLEEPIEQPEQPENDESEVVAQLEERIAELEAQLAEKDEKIAELENKVTEQEEKLKLSVETPLIKKNKTIENKALKYF